jgi:DNA-binding NtrC family response regulator
MADGKPPNGRRNTVVIADRSQIRLQRCKLVVMTGANKGGEFEISGAENTVGSNAGCDLQVEDATVSNRHFAILRDEQSYLVRDLDSTNGTFLDNSRIKEAYIRPGALLRAGEVYFRFEPVYERIELVPSETTEFGGLQGQSFRMREIFAVLEKVAPTEATVLLQGETGTGKGAVARAIHHGSPRTRGPFIIFDCGAIAPTLVESELFGHERGAFTGAVQLRRGALEQAHGGTLFIDELSDLSIDLQPKLLRALEDREFTRVGSHKSIKMDCRIIAATQRDLWSEVTAGRFREDLYFRLAVVTIPLPPLRDRREDIPLLADRFLREIAADGFETFDTLSAELKHKVLGHDYPGNIRELRNTMERAALMDPTTPLAAHEGRAREMPPATTEAGTLLLAADCDAKFKEAKEKLVSAFEKEYLNRLLERTGHNIAKAAREAGIDRKHLYTLLAKHGLGGSEDA